MWNKLLEKFKRRKAGFEIVLLMLETGIKLKNDGHYYINDVKIADQAISEALKINRRIVRDTALFILEDQELRKIFTNIKSSGVNLQDIAPILNMKAILIQANPNDVGVLSKVMQVFGDLNILVRQAIADDPELYPEPKIMIIYEEKNDQELIQKLTSMDIIRSIRILNK